MTKTQHPNYPEIHLIHSFLEFYFQFKFHRTENDSQRTYIRSIHGEYWTNQFLDRMFHLIDAKTKLFLDSEFIVVVVGLVYEWTVR